MNDSLHQFYLDVPRMSVYLNGVETRDPETVINYSRDRHPEHVDMIIFMLTQTFLAKFYIEEHTRRIINEEYLLDNGEYVVNIIDNMVTIEKDFKVIYFYTQDSYYIIDYCTLCIIVDLEDPVIIYEWKCDLGDSVEIGMSRDFS